MTKSKLEKLIEGKRHDAQEAFENLHREDVDQYYEKLKKAKRVNWDEKEFKQLIEEVKALEFILSDKEELENVESGSDWTNYVSRFTING